MKKSWMNRLIISYLPVYLVSTSAIIVFLVMSIIHAARNDLNAANHEAATSMIAGTARSMGITVVDD